MHTNTALRHIACSAIGAMSRISANSAVVKIPQAQRTSTICIDKISIDTYLAMRGVQTSQAVADVALAYCTVVY